MANHRTASRVVQRSSVLLATSPTDTAVTSRGRLREICPSHSTIHLGARVGHILILTHAEIEELTDEALAEGLRTTPRERVRLHGQHRRK